MSTPKVRLHDLGLVDYLFAWDYQERLFKDLIEEKRRGNTVAENHLILCEHPHVYTLGKSGDSSNLLLGRDELSKIDATFYQINRGGDITYHGPGQLVVYPIFDLEQYFTDIHKYMRYLEEAVILTLNDFGIEGSRIEGLTGVWIQGVPSRKIAAFGVKCSRWVTMHGIGFNVNTDLTYFHQIIPCGITDKAVTSMSYELSGEVSMQKVKESIMTNLKGLFGFSML